MISITAELGKIGVVEKEPACPSFVNQHICLVRPKKNDADPHFLGEFLAASPQRIRFNRLNDAGAKAGLNLRTIERFLVSLPPLPEQRKIAEILRTWDAAIETLEAVRAAKEKQYRALAQRYFGPCHSSFDERPNDWQERCLGEVFKERREVGKDIDRLLSITMNDGVIDRDEVGRKDTSTDDKSKYKLILPGDIGYNTMRMWQGVSGLSALRGIVSPAYTVVTPVEKRILGRYAAHLFKSQRMTFDFQRYSQGLTSDTWNLKFPAFSKIKIFLPPTELQEKQANLLDTLREEALVEEKQIKAVSCQKRGLIQKLLAGEWRVSV